VTREAFLERLPGLLLALASLGLAVGFALPIGPERQAGTRYAPLAGYVGTFAVAKDSVPAVASSGGAAWGLVAQAVRHELPPVQADEVLSRVESRPSTEPSPKRPSARRRRPRKEHRAVAVPVAVALSSSAASAAPLPALPTAAVETSDTVSDAYENDPARYPMDAAAEQGAISLRLRGMSRAGKRWILKVAVTNRGDADFFVRELVVLGRSEDLAPKSYMRVFVESGRTREGFVVFDRPRSGAVVHVALKEDRENGRVIELPVPYSF
jgi:hypothetical protein